MWRTPFQILGRDEATGLRVIHHRRAEELLERSFEAINWIFWTEEAPKAAEYVFAGKHSRALREEHDTTDLNASRTQVAVCRDNLGAVAEGFGLLQSSTRYKQL